MAVALRLVDDDYDMSLEIPVSNDFREALMIQVQRCAQEPVPFEFRLVLSLAGILDGDLQPPTQSQVSYATSIAKALRIAVPAEALKYKGSMHQFLSYHVPLFKRPRR